MLTVLKGSSFSASSEALSFLFLTEGTAVHLRQQLPVCVAMLSRSQMWSLACSQWTHSGGPASVLDNWLAWAPPQTLFESHFLWGDFLHSTSLFNESQNSLPYFVYCASWLECQLYIDRDICLFAQSPQLIVKFWTDSCTPGHWRQNNPRSTELVERSQSWGQPGPMTTLAAIGSSSLATRRVKQWGLTCSKNWIKASRLPSHSLCSSSCRGNLLQLSSSVISKQLVWR